jgi:hypothetical protein
MAIRKRLTGSMLAAGAATALVIGVSAGAALAVNATWTVKPGGAITAKAGTTTLTDTSQPAPNNTVKCTSSSTKTTLKKGSGLSGTGIGSITSISFSNCVGPLGFNFVVTSGHLPWHLNATSFNKTTGVTTGTITGIHSKLVSGSVCSAVVDGTSGTANNGMVKVTYTNSTGKLKVLTTGGNLHIYNVQGCAGLIANNDASTFSGTYTVSPKQTITSP